MPDANPSDGETLPAGTPRSADRNDGPRGVRTILTDGHATPVPGGSDHHGRPAANAPHAHELTPATSDALAATQPLDSSAPSRSSFPDTVCLDLERPHTADAERTLGLPADPPDVATWDGEERNPGYRRPIPAIAGYELLGELGRGGMGVVYHARQVLLDRPCALKMILAGAHSDLVTATRFMDEAKAIARLQHPNVVQIRHVGADDGLPYFELEYLEGGSLDRRLDGTPWPAQQAAALVEPLGRAVAEAHRLGIVHRDLKPSNVLLAADGTPKVTDFGLVKWLTADDGLTASDSILGSPSYMAPEQAAGRGREIGPAADIYALGVILYELLVGRPPFRGASILETLRLVRDVEPVPPSRLVPETPRDLETIVLKCLQKEPGRRYQAAAELAEDLRRFLAGEPIMGRPVGAWERAVKWARRRPAAALTAVTILLAGASLLAMGGWSYRSISRARDLAERRRREATALAYRALLGETRALRFARTPGWRSTSLENLRSLATMQTPQRDLSDLRTEAIAGLAELDVREVARLDRGQNSVRPGFDLIFGLDFSPDARTVICAGYNGSRFLWNWAEDRATPLSDDSTIGQVEPWSLQAALPAVRSHPGGSYLAATTGGGRVTLLGHEGRKPPVAAIEGSGQPRGLAFDRRGRLLAITWSDGRLVLYDAATGRSLRDFGPTQIGEFYRPVAISPDGARVAFAGPNFTVQVVDAAGASRPRTVGRHGAQIRDLAFSADGSSLASASEDRSAKVWDVGSAREVLTLQGHASQLTCLDWSPGGEWIATGGDDLTIRLWDARTGRLQMTVSTVIPEAVRFSPDGSHLAVAGVGVAVFELTGHGVGRLLVQGVRATAVAIDPIRPQLVAASTSQSVSLHDLRRQGEVWSQNANAAKLLFSPDGRRLVAICRPRNREASILGPALLLDSETGNDLGALGTESAIAAAFDSTGRRLALADGSGRVILHDVLGNRTEWRQQPARGPVLGVVFLGGDDRLLIGDCGGQLLILDTKSGRTIRRGLLPSGVFGLAATQDGRLLAAADSQEVIRFIDSSDLKPIAVLAGASHAVGLDQMVFSPDGRRLATSDRSRRISIWDVRSARKLFGLPSLDSPITDLAFASDGTRLAVATAEASITLWDLRAIASVLAVTGLDPNDQWFERGRPELATLPDQRLLRHPFSSALAGTFGNLRAGFLQYVLEAGPDQAGPSMELAWARLMGPAVIRDPDAALPLARRAVELAPDEPLCRGTLGVAYARLGRWADALAELRQAGLAHHGGPIAMDLFFQAICLHRLGQSADARERFAEALRARRAEDRTDMDRVTELNAIQSEADRVLRGENPPPPAAGLQDLLLAAALYSNIGRLTEAETQLNRVLAIRPRDDGILIERGRVRERWGHLDEAAADFAEALERMPTDMQIWSGRSALCNELTARPEVFNRLLAMRPDDPALRLALGLDLARRGDLGRAVAAFDRAGWFGASNEYTFDHACLRLLAGDTESYRRLVARLSAGDGATTDVARCFVLARTSSLAPGAGAAPADVVRWGERAARGDGSPWVLHALGLAYLRAARPLDAIRILEKSEAVGGWGGQVNNWLALALAHHAMGHDAEAGRWSNRAVAALERTRPAVFDEAGSLRMPDWLEARVLRRELEEKMPGPSLPANVFAR